MRTLKVTLEIKVDDFVPDFEEDGDPPESIDEYEARDVADVFNAMNEFTSAELFGGSAIYAKFTECRVIDAAWKE